MKIGVHIERLVLDGVSARQPLRLQAALERELARLFKQGMPGEFAKGGAVPSVKAPLIHLDTTGDSTLLGTRLARTIYGGLGKPK